MLTRARGRGGEREDGEADESERSHPLRLPSGGRILACTDLESNARARIGGWLRDKYRLDRVLGVGGMASVFAVTHRNGRRFALKMLHAELSVRRDVRKRFLREGYIANVVDHPGAVAVLDDDVTDDGAAFLVMELLDGETVDAILVRDGRLSEAVVLALAAETLDVLAAAHDKNVVHRDIKPANVFVVRSGEVKVLDFGIARLRTAEASSATHTGIALGTPAFMSPEQALGREVDGRSDLFSVGAMMFTLLTGKYVHEGEAGQELMVRAATEPARPLAALAPDASPAVAAIVDRALAFSALDRWQNAPEMRNEVREAYAAHFACEPPRDRLATLVAHARAITVLGPGAVASDPHDTTAVAHDQDSAELPTPRLAPEHLPPATHVHRDWARANRELLTVAGVASEAGEVPIRDGAASSGRTHVLWMAGAGVGVAAIFAALLVNMSAAPSASPAAPAAAVPLPATSITAAPNAAATPASSVTAAASAAGGGEPGGPVSAVAQSAPKRATPPPAWPAPPRASPGRPASAPAAARSVDPLAP